MTAGALNFTLGMNAAQFNSAIGAAMGRLAGFLGMSVSIGAALHKMWAAMEKGANLYDLAAGAGIAVKDLHQLRRAFDEVGASAESVPAIINRLRRTLASGEQDNLLSKLGLDPAALAKANPAAQFQRIAEAMAKLSVNDRSLVAQKLFGREGAETILKITNSAGDFKEAMAAAAKDAEIWQRVAKTFDGIMDAVGRIAERVSAITASITGDLVKAFQDGKLADLIALSIGAGVEKGLQIFEAGAIAMGEILSATFNNPKLWTGIIEGLISSFVSLGTTLSELLFGPIADFLGESERKAFDERQQERREYAERQGRDAVSNITAGTSAAMPRIIDAFTAAWQKMGIKGPAGEALDNFLADLRKGMGTENSENSENSTGMNLFTASPKLSEVTNFEKMGFVFAGLGRGFGGDDSPRRTAENTRNTVRVLERIEGKMTTHDDSFANRD